MELSHVNYESQERTFAPGPRLDIAILTIFCLTNECSDLIACILLGKFELANNVFIVILLFKQKSVQAF